MQLDEDQWDVTSRLNRDSDICYIKREREERERETEREEFGWLRGCVDALTQVPVRRVRPGDEDSVSGCEYGCAGYGCGMLSIFPPRSRSRSFAWDDNGLIDTGHLGI